MAVSGKIKTSGKKIEQNKQCNLDRQAAKISALLSGNVGKYEFLTSEDVLLEKELLEKAPTIKIFEYSPLGSELRKQTDIVGKQYLGLNKVYGFDKNEDDKTNKKDQDTDKTPTTKNIIP